MFLWIAFVSFSLEHTIPRLETSSGEMSWSQALDVGPLDVERLPAMIFWREVLLFGITYAFQSIWEGRGRGLLPMEVMAFAPLPIHRVFCSSLQTIQVQPTRHQPQNYPKNTRFDTLSTIKQLLWDPKTLLESSEPTQQGLRHHLGHGQAFLSELLAPWRASVGVLSSASWD